VSFRLIKREGSRLTVGLFEAALRFATAFFMRYPEEMRSDDFTCPFCGADVSPNARGCGACGASKEDTGEWFHAASADGLGADDDFNYEEFLEREFGGGEPRRSGKDLFWWIVALITLIAFVWLAVGW